ncbi:NADP-dependent aldehyde dehydrogenase, partial [Aidingimonas halophila]
CYQNLSADLLPTALQDDNPLKVSRLMDGKRES